MKVIFKVIQTILGLCASAGLWHWQEDDFSNTGVSAHLQLAVSRSLAERKPD